jgi:hypothetical protein
MPLNRVRSVDGCSICLTNEMDQFWGSEKRDLMEHFAHHPSSLGELSRESVRWAKYRKSRIISVSHVGQSIEYENTTNTLPLYIVFTTLILVLYLYRLFSLVPTTLFVLRTRDSLKNRPLCFSIRSSRPNRFHPPLLQHPLKCVSLSPFYSLCLWHSPSPPKLLPT